MSYTFRMQDNGICIIQPESKISLELTAEIAQDVMLHITDAGLPKGLLIDVRYNTLLSIVRLSNLLDTLSGLGVSIAVVFWNDEQQRLAGLLHNTLAQKNIVAYFTSLDDAERYLLSDAPYTRSFN